METTNSNVAEAIGAKSKKAFYKHLYVQVIIATVIGIMMGYYYPSAGAAMKPFADNFLKLIKMLVAPLIFCTVVHGIASMKDMKQLGRVGFKTLIYFEIITTIALVLGLIIVNLLEPGKGLHINAATLDASSIAQYAKKAHDSSVVGFLSDIIPTTIFNAFTQGNILQVLLISILFAFGLQALGERGRPVLNAIDAVSHAIFGMVRIVMYLSPLGAFGAMAFTIGKYGVSSLVSYGYLLFTYYLTVTIFVFVVLGLVCRLFNFSLMAFLRYIADELVLVVSTSSSESALPRLIQKMKRLGCNESVVGLVVPSGYSFNLDGSCINMTVLAIFIAQATDTPLTLMNQVTLLLVLMLASKGAAAVSGGAFIVLAATLGTIPGFPVAGLVLVLGVYRFISEGGALVNVIGNGIATVVVSKWEKALDENIFKEQLASGPGDIGDNDKH
jgi:aerobic C4-dicarboxylate transport protein